MHAKLLLATLILWSSINDGLVGGSFIWKTVPPSTNANHSQRIITRYWSAFSGSCSNLYYGQQHTLGTGTGHGASPDPAIANPDKDIKLDMLDGLDPYSLADDPTNGFEAPVERSLDETSSEDQLPMTNSPVTFDDSIGHLSRSDPTLITSFAKEAALSNDPSFNLSNGSMGEINTEPFPLDAAEDLTDEAEKLRNKRLLVFAEWSDTVSQGSVVTTLAGPILGINHAKLHIREFLGIPYGKPPAGSLRWRPPVPADLFPHWALFDARHYGNHCLQLDTWGSSYFRTILVGMPSTSLPSEDCLNLNVYTPSIGRLKASMSKRIDSSAPNSGNPHTGLFPVIFFIHGGMFTTGGNCAPICQPHDLVIHQNVVVVAPNYRLGLFGFLGSKELEQESEGSGNYALMDLLLALQWTKHNVASFGGDPDNITLMGHSAGSVLASYLLIMLRNHQDLVHRAIFMSGAYGTTHIRTTNDLTIQPIFDKLASQAGCDESKGDILEQLRQIDGKTLNGIAISLDWSLKWGPVTGNQLFPVHPRELYEGGEFARVPILVTSCRDDGTIFTVGQSFKTSADFLGMLEQYFGPVHVPDIAKLYDPVKFGGMVYAASAICRDAFFKGPVLDLAVTAQPHVPSVHHYEFNRSLYLSWMASPMYYYGVFHGTDLILLFAGIRAMIAMEKGSVRSTQRRIMTFMVQNDPNDPSYPKDKSTKIEPTTVIDSFCAKWRDWPISTNLLYSQVDDDPNKGCDLMVEETTNNSSRAIAVPNAELAGSLDKDSPIDGLVNSPSDEFQPVEGSVQDKV